MRRSFTGGSRTGLVNADSRVTANINLSTGASDARGDFGDGSMTPLPPPRTFAEGQRLVYGLLAAAAGMFSGICAVAMIALLMWGGWSASEEHSIVVIFGWSLGGFITAMVAVIIGLLAGGPVGRFRVSATRDGAMIEAASDPCAPEKGT
jgi:hypothetical protein